LAQWSQLGCQIRKGEKATTVVFWKQMRKGDPGDAEPDGDEREEQARFFARGYCVFNANQVDGYAPLDMPHLSESLTHNFPWFSMLWRACARAA
jgi:antirestriction protein ArdC